LPLPLSDEAIALLGKPDNPDDLLFPSLKDHAFNLKVMFGFQGKDDPEPYADLHGLRGVFRGWARANKIPDDGLEAILSHGVAKMQDGRRAPSQVAAYMNGHDFAPEMRDALERWDKYCTGR
jgi:hypothetical protein